MSAVLRTGSAAVASLRVYMDRHGRQCTPENEESIRREMARHLMRYKGLDPEDTAVAQEVDRLMQLEREPDPAPAVTVFYRARLVCPEPREGDMYVLRGVADDGPTPERFPSMGEHGTVQTIRVLHGGPPLERFRLYGYDLAARAFMYHPEEGTQ